MVAKVVGSAAQGLSSGGNAYNQALGQGYTEEQARGYAAVRGISEAGLQYAMGGLSKLGGVSGRLATKIDDIGNGTARFLTKIGVSAVPEGMEEALQNALDSIYRAVILTEDLDFDVEGMVYDFLMGELLGGVSGAGDGLASSWGNVPKAIDTNTNGEYNGSDRTPDALNNGEAASQGTLEEIERNWHGDEEKPVTEEDWDSEVEGEPDEDDGEHSGNSGELNWDAIISKKGETRDSHINRHAIPEPMRATHGVFNGNPQDTVNQAWRSKGNIVPIKDGMGGEIYNIPFANAGYESGFRNTGAKMDYVTIIVIEGTSEIIAAFPSFGDFTR